jgi:YfiH family protein
MHRLKGKEYFILPRLERIPHLFHGFGTKRLTMNSLSDLDEFADFNPVLLQQIHSNIIRIIKEEPKGPIEGDALITSLPDILLIIRTADCLPVFIIDESRRVIAAVHCGWRGTVSRILEKVLGKVAHEFGCQPGSLTVAFGPCIAPECYEVGKDVYDRFHDQALPLEVFKDISGRGDKFRLDLREANQRQLLESGVPKLNMWGAFSCSHCDDRFFSHRREPEKTDRLLNFIGWRK